MSEPAWAIYDYAETKAALDHVHNPNSSANVGERVAAMVNANTKDELEKRVRDHDETFAKIAEHLIETQESLKVRLELVEQAIARVMLAAEPDGEPQALQ